MVWVSHIQSIAWLKCLFTESRFHFSWRVPPGTKATQSKWADDKRQFLPKRISFILLRLCLDLFRWKISGLITWELSMQDGQITETGTKRVQVHERAWAPDKAGRKKSWKIRLQCVDFDRIYRHHRSRFWSERTSDQTSIPLLWLLCGRTNRHIWFLGFQGGCCSHSDETRQVSSVKGAKRGERSNRTDALKDPPPPPPARRKVDGEWWSIQNIRC